LVCDSQSAALPAADLVAKAFYEFVVFMVRDEVQAERLKETI
jgi:hypothetical protein